MKTNIDSRMTTKAKIEENIEEELLEKDPEGKWEIPTQVSEGESPVGQDRVGEGESPAGQDQVSEEQSPQVSEEQSPVSQDQVIKRKIPASE